MIYSILDFLLSVDLLTLRPFGFYFEAVASRQMPTQEISAQTLNAAIQFLQWMIKQTELLYTDLGITEHQDSAKITRFVEQKFTEQRA